MERSSGVLMPIFSLPSDTGIGNFGENAYKFIDLLKDAKQSYWQLLPLNPVDVSNSPYFSVSHFAGNPLFIDLNSLVDEGLLDNNDIQNIDTENNKNYIQYEIAKSNIFGALKKAYKNFIKSDLNIFKLYIFKCQFDKYIKDYVLFESMKTVFNKAFVDWDDKYKYYNVDSNNDFISNNVSLVNYNYFLQYLFFKQWFKLKKYANSKGIQIIGDMPIYSSNDSSDVWANSKNYLLDENLKPTEIAGCPPDAFNSAGQLWGNPLYNYDYMKQNNYDYMMKKFSLLFRLYNVIRIDHFRGFESYYAIKAGDTDARNGSWRKGPGIDLFKTLHKKIKTTNIIAEDLGFITDDVKKLLYDTGYPGMKVMQFAFSHWDDQNNPYRPHNYPENSVAYLGTHDNDTFMGWYNSICSEDKNIVDNYLGISSVNQLNVGAFIECPCRGEVHEPANSRGEVYEPEILVKALQTLYASKSNLVILNIQDLLGIGSEGRINTPSTLSDKNWSYRFTKEQLFNEQVTNALKKLTIDSNR